MTRINVGVLPEVLCDQHLLAEYRELPRLWRYIGKPPKNAPEVFCLGKGHVLWCANHLPYMVFRFNALVKEMQRRRFSPQYTDPPPNAPAPEDLPPVILAHARSIMIPRINSRLSTMKRQPTWTRTISTEDLPWNLDMEEFGSEMRAIGAKMAKSKDDQITKLLGG